MLRKSATARHLQVIARSRAAATKQSRTARIALDCFVASLLAMTNSRYAAGAVQTARLCIGYGSRAPKDFGLNQKRRGAHRAFSGKVGTGFPQKMRQQKPSARVRQQRERRHAPDHASEINPLRRRSST